MHCASGISRSGTIVLATLIDEGMTLADAWKQVAASRRVLLPSDANFEVLCELDEAKHGSRSMTSMDYKAWALASTCSVSLSKATAALLGAHGDINEAAGVLWGSA